IFMICTAHSSVYLLCGSVFYGLGAGLLMPAIMTWLFNVVAPARRSNASATYYNTMDLGTCLGIVLLGTLAGHVGYVAIFYGVLAVMGLYIAFTLWAWKSGHMTDRRTPPSGSPVP
ncbi:MFS transporter, partial [Megasphaera sp. DJF_B143]|uniref:MFS transporter n=1 Tax=Megasphaera sp. DJF_B143 TaxID=537288 RepID=UPI0012433DCD